MKQAMMNNAYPNGIIGNGVFTDLQAYNVPWRDENINSQLDILYYSKSGTKLIGNILTSRLVDDVLPVDARDTIAETVYMFFQTKWQKLYALLFAEYNPIENYRMIETETANHSIESDSTNTGTLTNVDSGTVTIADGGTISTTGTSNADTSVYGFNSAQSVGTDETNNQNSGTETRNLQRTETRNLQETETRNLTNSNSETGENERELTRSGNIGVTTSQQMIQSEIELWQWNYFEQVFADIDYLLCLSIY